MRPISRLAVVLVIIFAATALPGLVLPTSWVGLGDQSDAEFGTSVSSGDINGDGYDDVIVGQPRYTNGTFWEGRAQIYYGSAAGLPPTASWSKESDLPPGSPEFGRSVGSAGDVDGDGFDDVIVGAPFANARGEAYLFLGSPTGALSTPAWTAFPGVNHSKFGSSVAGAGDVNGDGYEDVIVGAPNFINSTAQGAAFVYHGSPLGLSTTPTWSIYGPRSYYSGLGATVAAAGDVNGDGYDDVILGADQFTNGQSNEGGAFVYLGSPTGLGASPAWAVESNRADERFGLAVAGGGDFNGDGYSDVVVAAPLYDGTLENEGIVRVYHGSALGLGTTPAFTTQGTQLNILFGQSVNGRNDVDGDGYADLAVGAIWQAVNQHIRGAARVYYGSPTGLIPSEGDTVMGPQDGSEFGSSITLAGDVDADGFADMVVGAPHYHDDSVGLTNSGLTEMHPGHGSTLDRDGDGRSPAQGDCDDRNAQIWARPQAVANVRFVDAETIAWDSQNGLDGQTISFDVLRSGSPQDFVSAITCVRSNEVLTEAVDPTLPPGADQVMYYLVRAENGCPGVTRRGPAGMSSAGLPRSARDCP